MRKRFFLYLLILAVSLGAIWFCSSQSAMWGGSGSSSISRDRDYHYDPRYFQSGRSGRSGRGRR